MSEVEAGYRVLKPRSKKCVLSCIDNFKDYVYVIKKILKCKPYNVAQGCPFCGENFNK